MCCTVKDILKLDRCYNNQTCRFVPAYNGVTLSEPTNKDMKNASIEPLFSALLFHTILLNGGVSRAGKPGVGAILFYYSISGTEKRILDW